MSPETEQRAIADRLNALCLTVEGGFRDLKKDVGYLGKFYIPLAAVALVGLVMSILALAVALENRTLIVSLAHQAAVEERLQQTPYTAPSTRASP